MIHHGFHHFPFHLGFHYHPWYAWYGSPWYGDGYYPYTYYDGPIYSRGTYVVDQGYSGNRADGDIQSDAQLPLGPNRQLEASPLIDDLNAPLAVGEASPQDALPTGVPKPDTKILAALANLSPADRAAALAQRTCPVTGDALGSDGTPIKVRVKGRDVFVCCQGCVKDLRGDPDLYLSSLDGSAR